MLEPLHKMVQYKTVSDKDGLNHSGLNKLPHTIGLGKSGYQVNNFLICQQKHMLWVLIRSASVYRYFLVEKSALPRALPTLYIGSVQF